MLGTIASDRERTGMGSPERQQVLFRHCQHDSDVYDYQSQQIDVLLVDEATHFTWFIIDYLLTRNRASGEVKLTGFKPFCFVVSKPGNIGHAWYSQIYDMEKKQERHEQVKTVMNPNGKRASVYFLPALLDDNKIRVAADPEYEDRLMQRKMRRLPVPCAGVTGLSLQGRLSRTGQKERVAVPKQKQFEIPFIGAVAGDGLWVHPPGGNGMVYCHPQTSSVYLSGGGGQ